MLGPEKRRDEALFIVGFSLEERVPLDHPLRKIAETIDFSFVRDEVAELYGDRGQVSVDPIVILKLLFLAFYHDVKSSRELMRQLPMRLDWLWFCNFDLDDPIPDHSVISKAKARWGRDVFVRFFTRVLQQCIEAGLVDGRTAHIDASVNQADASLDSIRRLKAIGEELYEDDDPKGGSGRSSTDPDATLIKKTDGSKSILGYKDHRVVDDRCGIITATVTTPARRSEPLVFEEAVRQHEFNTGLMLQTPVTARQYGTAQVYRYVHERGMTPCIPRPRTSENMAMFPRRLFIYDPEADHYTCPAGEIMVRRRVEQNRARYGASTTTCGNCVLKPRCTTGAHRLLSRHLDQEIFDWADQCHSASERRRLMSRRKSKVEGSFADAANNHGFKRLRWRGLTNATIQHLLIATIQNIRKLIRQGGKGRRPWALASGVLHASREVLGAFDRLVSRHRHLVRAPHLV